MTITDVTRSWDGETGGWQSRDGVEGTQSIVIPYTAVSDDASDDMNDVKAHPSTPKQGDALLGNPAYICRGVRGNRRGPNYFDFGAEYVADSADGNDQDPTNRAAKLSVRTIRTEEPIDEDGDGNPIATVLGEPILGLTDSVVDMAIVIQKNLQFFNLNSVYFYVNGVSSDDFLGFPAGEAKIIDLGAEFVSGNVTSYWEVEAEIHFRYPYRTTSDKAWYKRVRHEGFYHKKNGIITRATDETGADTIKPVFLDSNGNRIPSPNPPQVPTAEWLEFKPPTFHLVNIGSLGLWP